MQHRRAENQQREAVGEQVREAAVKQRRDENSREADPLARSNAETLELQSPTEQRDEPEQGDESKRELGRQPEVIASALGTGEGRIGRMNLH